MRLQSWKRSMMIVALSATVVTGGALIRAFADAPKEPAFRRVESITIDPLHCKLRWTISRGEVHDGKYAPKGKIENYEIAFHQAEMMHNGTTHKFSLEEAVRVHQVMLEIGRYTAESVDWFEKQEAPVMRASTR